VDDDLVDPGCFHGGVAGKEVVPRAAGTSPLIRAGRIRLPIFGACDVEAAPTAPIVREMGRRCFMMLG
jgi:hypothetical protein